MRLNFVDTWYLLGLCDRQWSSAVFGDAIFGHGVFSHEQSISSSLLVWSTCLATYVLHVHPAGLFRSSLFTASLGYIRRYFLTLRVDLCQWFLSLITLFPRHRPFCCFRVDCFGHFAFVCIHRYRRDNVNES